MSILRQKAESMLRFDQGSVNGLNRWQGKSLIQRRLRGDSLDKSLEPRFALEFGITIEPPGVLKVLAGQSAGTLRRARRSLLGGGP